jgi:predicted PurR-regulated permease PerM
VTQDDVASPRIMGRHLEIHPLAAIFAVLVGAEIRGIVGIYLAVPLMASMDVIWRRCAGPGLTEGGVHCDLDVTVKAPSSLAETATT